jgi:hypothetical protein
MCQLFSNRVVLLLFVSKRGDVAERAASAADSAIAIRAAKPAMQRQFMNLFAIAPRKIPTKHID